MLLLDWKGISTTDEPHLKLLKSGELLDGADLEDDDLMLLCRQDRHDAFEVLVQRHEALAFGLATRFLGDRSLGRDVAQDVFLSIWAERERYRPRGRFRSYLVSVTLNRCRHLARQRGSHKRKVSGLNRDSAVTYEEVAGFVWTANAAIPAPRYRPSFYVRPPRRETAAKAVLVDLQGATGDWLQAGPGSSRHFYVEDGRGLRLADFHPGPQQEVAILLPFGRPLFLRLPELRKEVELPQGRRIVLADLSLSTVGVSARGAEHVAFRKLFARPFGRASLVEYRSSSAVVEAPAGRNELRWLRRTLGISAAALAVAGGTMSALAYAEREGVEPDTSGLARGRTNVRIGRYNTAAVSCYAVAGAALATYLVWTLWPEEDVQIHVLPMRAQGAALSFGF